MTDKEITDACVNLACECDLEYDEYQEVLKASLEEKERVEEYYGISN